jgi:DNA-binding IclR family transcriptional regulator
MVCMDPTPTLTAAELNGDTPTMRLFALLELVVAKDRFVSLPDLVAETGLPKPTVHRMLQQLESAGLLVRQGDSRQYGTGARLRRFAETLLLNATQHGARHAVLRDLVERIGETCNVTALAGNEVIYLDRVETAEPLRFALRSGSRVPVHCSASGKLLLSQFGAAQRHKLLAHAPLKRYTDNTITDLEGFERELDTVRRDGYALDNEEFLPGLVCAAVLVPSAASRSNLCVALQAPTLRVTADRARELVPALRDAAEAVSRIEAEGAAE